ncbi:MULTISPECIES: STAS domain-containing protein [Thermomonosporaceae]|uniref:STAS domain-containing protein n=1 Tax=Thermomonosporaceae TaxID=2012 RepID=UPI00255B3F69|nr:MULTISPECIES: STAS domain-containing protein [Thermomonosporaceae]MDL4777255.1 STAS domain-containing protein [Actinomadura xylanilytica]
MIDEGRAAARRPGRRGPEVRCRAGARPAGGPGTALDGPAAGGPREQGPVAGLDVSVAQVHGETVVAAVTGEIDLHTADTLRVHLVELHEAGFRRLVVDFAGVPFCDATGLGALVAAHNQISGAGGEIRLARVRPAQVRLLRITGLYRLFTLYDDIAGAIAEAGSSAAPRC